MAVSGNQDCVLVGREREQVVVPGIYRAFRWRAVWVSHEDGRSREPCHEGLGVGRGYQASQLRICEGATEFSKQSRGDDQLEMAVLPGQQ